MLRGILTLTLSLCLGASAAPAALAQGAGPAVTEQEAHAIGVDAYLYFYPLLTMDLTRKQSTNIEPGKEFGKGPMNMFVSVPAYPPERLNSPSSQSPEPPRCLAPNGPRSICRPRCGRSLPSG